MHFCIFESLGSRKVNNPYGTQRIYWKSFLRFEIEHFPVKTKQRYKCGLQWSEVLSSLSELYEARTCPIPTNIPQTVKIEVIFTFM